jgi:beta propeller repeat protein
LWLDERNGKPDIYMQNLSSKKQTRITTNGSNHKNPAINGDRIVWQDNRNGNWDIYMYDISTRKETQITTDEHNQTEPDIFGGRIVWMDDRNQRDPGLPWELQIYMYDISTSTETMVDYGEGGLYTMDPPRIYGDRIVFIYEDTQGHSNLEMYDLSTSETTWIAVSDVYVRSPAIYGNRIVWDQFETSSVCDYCNYDIFMYEISTSSVTHITTNEWGQISPAIYSDRFVWEDYRNGNSDIYMFTISGEGPTKPPVANFCAAPTSGKAPLKVKFTSTSTGAPTTWKWNFGDGTYSTAKNPAHTYGKAGKYTVSLTTKKRN